MSNAMGTQPITFDNVYAGLQLSSAELFKHSNQTITFQYKKNITIQPGEWAWSDPVTLPFAKGVRADFLEGRKLAVSFHIGGTSGPMTWHAKALTTSYISAPNSGTVAGEEAETAFKYSTASWFFMDAVDMKLPKTTKVILNFGDSITDGTASTMNTDDRWPDVFSRRMHRQFGHKVVILNAGIGGNQIAGPADYSPQKPFAGGPSSLMRLERDVLSLSGVNLVVWLEGINDFSKNGNASLELVTSKLSEGIQRLNQGGIKVLGATVGSALNSSSAAHGSQEQDTKRKGLNQFIKTSTLFEGYVDFDEVSLDPATGEMRAEFIPESTTGGAGEKLHPNRVGYQAMGNAFDLSVIAKILNLN
jgi:lysophospholipase L1-like esterase